ncbi:MAG: hypothetical protein P4L74_06985 [Candidatus Doudnabacteria bacterium]|nr:hypothetical protein [Candidatus Doudnabacteria bacterium]
MKSKILEKRVVKTKVLIYKSREHIKHLRKRLVEGVRKYKQAVENERVIAAEKRRM